MIMETAPAQPKQTSGALRIFMIICAVIVLLGGMATVWKGVQKFRTRNTPEFKRAVADSDNAIKDAVRYAGEATPLFQQMLKDVDSQGLADFRAHQKEAATKTNQLLGDAADSFRQGKAKLEEAQPLNRKEQLAPYLAVKARSYGLRAQAIDINQEIVGFILDDSIATIDALVPKLTEAAARRDEIAKSADAADKEANEIGQRIQGPAKK
jgi:hypothetical protein